MSIESVMPSSHLILCCPLLLPPSIFPSIRVFSNESALCIRWQEYWSFSFSISPSWKDTRHHNLANGCVFRGGVASRSVSECEGPLEKHRDHKFTGCGPEFTRQFSLTWPLTAPASFIRFIGFQIRSPESAPRGPPSPPPAIKERALRPQVGAAPAHHAPQEKPPLTPSSWQAGLARALPPRRIIKVMAANSRTKGQFTP